LKKEGRLCCSQTKKKQFTGTIWEVSAITQSGDKLDLSGVTDSGAAVHADSKAPECLRPLKWID